MPSTELKLFTAAMAVETAHLLDDGLLQPHDGVTDVPSALIAVAISVAAVALFPRLARGARAVLAGLFGLAGLAAGLEMHVIPALQHGAEGSDYSGFGQATAGIVLLALAATLAVRRRAPRPA
jgi:Flp pilus assembly pilin Flp